MNGMLVKRQIFSEYVPNITLEKGLKMGEKGQTGKDQSVDGASSPSRGEMRAIASEDLFPAGERRVVIRHEGRDYVLLVTRQGKLLLNRLN